MNVLAIDTSTNVLGVGIVSEEKVIGEYITNIKRNHSTRVLPAIDYLLNDCGLHIKDINKIVVANGPGSYTGLRIGITIGKTLAWTLNVPISGVSTLQLIAANGKYFEGVISPLIDARRGNIYTGLYKYSDGRWSSVLNDRHISSVEWAKKLKNFNENILFIGENISTHRTAFETELKGKVSFSPVTLNNPRPGELGLIGMDLPEMDIHSFVPNYLRLAEAEAKWREKMGNRM